MGTSLILLGMKEEDRGNAIGKGMIEIENLTRKLRAIKKVVIKS